MILLIFLSNVVSYFLDNDKKVPLDFDQLANDYFFIGLNNIWFNAAFCIFELSFLRKLYQRYKLNKLLRNPKT